MKLKYILFVGICIITLFCNFADVSAFVQEDQTEVYENQHHDISELNEGNIGEYRRNYVPKKYYPTPEYMVFIDLGVLILLLLAGLFVALKRDNSRIFNILAIFTFVYLGFIRGGCICPVGLTTNVVMGMVDPSAVGLASLIVFLSPLVIALIAGRVFCSSGCPLGAVQHIFQKKKHIKLPKTVNKIIRFVPVVILLLTIYFAIKRTCFFVCDLDPYKAVFFTGQTWFEKFLSFITGTSVESGFLFAGGLGLWIYFFAILILGLWIPRPFCRLICPYGVLLGVVSFFSFKNRKIQDENCVNCGLCEKVCPTQAIVVDKNKCTTLSNYDCIQCNKCSDVCRKDGII